MKGVLLVHSGSPTNTELGAVKTFLDQVLSDPNVIDLPELFPTSFMRSAILNTHSKDFSDYYKNIWLKNGDPLMVASRGLQHKLQKQVAIPIGLAMRYAEPHLLQGLQELVAQNVTNLLVIPLYAHYAKSITGTITTEVEQLAKDHFPDLEIEILPPYYERSEYISVVGNHISSALKDKSVDHVLFNFRGIPEREIMDHELTKDHCKFNDICCNTSSLAHVFCYRHQCLKTTASLAEYLQLKPGTYSTSFQNLWPFDSGMAPSTARTLERLAKKGIKNVAVVHPGFITDSVETLALVGVEGKRIFTENDGVHYYNLPALNDAEAWVDVLALWIDRWRIVNVKTGIA